MSKLVRKWICNFLGHRTVHRVERITFGVYDLHIRCKRCGGSRVSTVRPDSVPECLFWDRESR